MVILTMKIKSHLLLQLPYEEILLVLYLQMQMTILN